MLNFFNKKLNSDEYEAIIKKFTDLTLLVEQFKGMVIRLDTEVASMRGRINRKFHGEPITEEKKETDKYQGQFLPE